MSETITDVADVTQPGTVYSSAAHGQSKPQPVDAPLLTVSVDHGHRVPHPWAPRCPPSRQHAAFTMPAPAPWTKNDGRRPRGMPNSTLESNVVDTLPVSRQSTQRHFRRAHKFLADSKKSRDSARSVCDPQTVFMGVAIGVLVVANCVAIGTALANQ